MRKTTRTAMAAVASVAAAGLVLAGCSSGDSVESDAKSAAGDVTSVAKDAGEDVKEGAEEAVDEVADHAEGSEEIDGPGGEKIKVKKPIAKKVDELGGTEEIGLPTDEQQEGPHAGYYLEFEDVTIYWTEVTDAQAIPGDITTALDDNGGLKEFGYPKDEGTSDDDGAMTVEFEKGTITVDAGGEVDAELAD